jgi:hypothetical protein
MFLSRYPGILETEIVNIKLTRMPRRGTNISQGVHYFQNIIPPHGPRAYLILFKPIKNYGLPFADLYKIHNYSHHDTQISYIYSHPHRTNKCVKFRSLSLFYLLAHSRRRRILFSLDHTRTHITVGRTPLDEGSARRRDLYLTTQTLYKRQTSMPSARFEPTIPASARLQTYALDGAATEIGLMWKVRIKMKRIYNRK